jgi:putative transposase
MEAADGLSRLSVWWIKLGITPVRIMPDKPNRTGGMNACKDPQGGNRPTVGGLARRPAAPFDHFRVEFNHERPHEALGQAVPVAVYTPSPRPYPARLEDPPYASDFERAGSAATARLNGRRADFHRPATGRRSDRLA